MIRIPTSDCEQHFLILANEQTLVIDMSMVSYRWKRMEQSGQRRESVIDRSSLIIDTVQLVEKNHPNYCPKYIWFNKVVLVSFGLLLGHFD